MYDYRQYSSYYRRKLSRYLPVGKDWRCLDLACGYGNFIGYLHACGVRHYLGVDTSQVATEAARQNFSPEKIITDDVFQHLASSTDVHDLISALDFIEHVTKAELFRLLELINARLKVGGLLLIRTPNAAGLFGPAARYADITHEICFTPDSLTDVLSRSGFSVTACWEDGPAPGSPSQIVHWLAWQTVRFCIRLINAAETGAWGRGILTRNMWMLAEKNRNSEIR